MEACYSLKFEHKGSKGFGYIMDVYIQLKRPKMPRRNCRLDITEWVFGVGNGEGTFTQLHVDPNANQETVSLVVSVDNR